MFKNLNKITLIIRAIVLLAFLVSEFLGFGFLPKAYAACNYTIKEFYAEKSAYDISEQIVLHTKVQINSGSNFSECQDQKARPVYFAKYQTLSGVGVLLGGTPSAKDVNTQLDQFNNPSFDFSGGDTASATKSYYLKDLISWSDSLDPNHLDFYVQVWTFGSDPIKTSSASYTISITGQKTFGGNGVMGLSLDYSPKSGSLALDKNENLSVKIQVPTSDLSKYPSEVDIKFFSVIGSGNKNQINGIGNTTKTKDDLKYQQQYTIGITSQNNFGSGTNSILVEMYQKGTGILVSKGSVVFQVAGQSSTAGAGTKNSQGTGNPASGSQQTAAGDGTGYTPGPSDKLYNPLPSGELTTVFLWLAKGFLGLVGVWAVLFIIVGGFRMVMAQGNEEALGAARKTVTWAVIGVIIAALSFSIIAIVQNLLRMDVKAPF